MKEFTRKSVIEFMERYFKAFDEFAQDPKNQYRMREYFTEDQQFIPYYTGMPHTTDLETFHKLNIHPDLHETLKPVQLVIDVEQKKVGALIDAKISDTATGEVKIAAAYNVIYDFRQDDNKDYKIAKIIYFIEHTPETARIMDILPTP